MIFLPGFVFLLCAIGILTTAWNIRGVEIPYRIHSMLVVIGSWSGILFWTQAFREQLDMGRIMFLAVSDLTFWAAVLVATFVPLLLAIIIGEWPRLMWRRDFAIYKRKVAAAEKNNGPKPTRPTRSLRFL